MSGQPLHSGELLRPRTSKIVLRVVMRFVMPVLMLGFGAYTVMNGGLQGLVALLPILAAHVVGFAIVFPLWIRYQRRRVATTANVSDGN
jgi:uncharacterized membrane protein